MLRVLGIFFLLILIEIPLVAVDFFWGNGFLKEFIKNQSLQIMGTFLGLNVASSVFLIGYLLNIETIKNKILFANTKSEIKQNIYFMIIIFFLHLALLVFTPSIGKHTAQYIKYIAQGMLYVNLYLFLLSMFALYELTSAIFVIDKFLQKK